MLNILKKLKNPFIIIAIGCAFSFAFFSLEVVEAQNFETDIESSIEIMNAGMPETTSGLSLRNFSVGGYALPGVAIFNLVSDGLQSASGFYDISMRNGITTYSTHYQTIMISPGFNGTVRTMHGSILAPLTEIPIESLGGLIRFHDMTGAPISELGIVYMPTPRFEVFGLREGEYWTNEDVTVRLTYDRDGILSSRTYNYNTLNQHFDLTFETAGYGLTSIKTPVQFNLNFQINRSLPQGSVTARNGNFDRSSPDHNSATNTFFYGYTNRSVEFHFFQNTNGNNVSVKIANEHPTLGFPEYTLSGNLVLLDSPGIYRITMTDLAGNQTSYRFVIEREIENISSTHNNSTPNITSIISGFTASNSGFIDLFDYIYSFGFSRQSSVTLSWIANPPSGNNVIANHNGNIVSSGFLNITAEGSHTVVFSDLAGNQKTFNFVIDRTPASGVLTGVTNGGFTNQNVLFSWTNKENGLAVNAEVTRPNGTMEVLSAQTLTFTEDGLYIIVLMDAIGNRSNDYSFTIDRRSTNAHLNFSALQINNHTRGAVNLFWTNFSNGNDVVSALISRNGNAAEIYTMNKNISEEGFFVITLTTRAGVISAHSFTIDNSLPTFSISETRGFSNSSLVLDGNNNARTNADSFTINFNPNQKNSLNLVSVLHNNTTFNNSFSVSSEGEHHFIIRDQIGNEVSFTITIDRTPPTINLVRSAGAQHIGSTSGIDGSINSNAFNFTLFFTWNKPGTTALLNRRTGLNFSDANDMHYSQGELIHLDGNYRLTVTDDVGNITIYFFEIRTTLPLDNFNALVNHNQSFAFRSQLWSVRDHNGTLYSFNNEEDARTFATWSEWQTIEQGPYDGSSQIFSNIHNTNSIPFHWPSHSWTAQWYYIYIDNLGNPIIFFGNPLFGDTAAIDSAIRFHVDRAITNGYLFMPTMISEIGQAFPGNPNIPNPRLQVPQDIFYRAIPFSGTGDQSEFPVIFFNRPSFPGLSNHNTNFRLRLGNTFSALMTHTELNNHIMNQTGSVIYHIQEIDFAGNIFEYRVVLVVNPPTFNVSTEFGNDISADFNNNLNSAATLFYTHRISLSAFDFFDSYNILEIRRVGEINWRRYWGGATAFLNESGVFEIRTRNRAGFISAIRTVNISLEEIQINVSEEINNSEDLDGFWFNISNLVEPNEIISITIWFNDIQIFVDSLGNPITSNRLSYFFSVNGRYTVQVVDRFNRMPVLTYELQRDLPVGRLFEFGSSLELQAGLTHFSNQGFFLNWSSAGAEAVWVFNGNEVTYTRNFIINAVGSHTIRLFHSSDPSIFREFYFVIDRTLPNAIIFDTNNVPIISGSRTNQNVIITWEEIRANGNIVSGTLNGLSINSGVEITEEGEFTLILRDSAGNSRTINFQIIKSPPTFQIWAGVTLILPETVTNQDVRVVWHDWSVTAVIFSNFNPARAYSSGSWIWEEGTHIIVLTDDAGNS
ncbi:MAG: hypothetical protein FWE36_08180, partial [Erysipelotrichales bacterium]|nr:hypothetical protein [Erysipelotrichales bacterium]